MMMVYNNEEIRIFGTTQGGRDNGNAWAANSIDTFVLDFTYDVSDFIEVANGGVDDTRVMNGHHQNFGMLTRQSDGMQWDLRSHANSSGLELQLGDRNGSGHRGFNGISGWGWLDYRAHVPGQGIDAGWVEVTNHPSDTGCCSDFLFTAVQTPEPSMLSWMGLGLTALILLQRKRL